MPERRDDERVIDLSAPQPRAHVGERQCRDVEDLAAVGPRRLGAARVEREVRVEVVVLDRRIGRYFAERAPAARREPGLLGQLALGGGARVLAWIDHAAGDL